MKQAAKIQTFALHGLPMFAPGMSIAREIRAAMDLAGDAFQAGDVCVLAQKIVSKVEGRQVSLAEVAPGGEASAMADGAARDPRLVQLILDESSEVLRSTPAAMITRHRTGHVLANAGIDASNVEGGDAGEVLLWPQDPDASARTIREELAALCGVAPAVLIVDSMGRAWRIGTVGTAIGCAGLTVLDDQRGTGRDLYGRTLQATIVAVADSIAAMATLVMGEGDEGTPAAVVRGLGRWVSADHGPGAASGLRPIAQDMFR